MIDPFQHLIGRPFVKTIVYLRTPKCASSTLFKAFSSKNLFWREKKRLEAGLKRDKKYQGLFDVSHCLPEEAVKIFGSAIRNFFIVSSCRNPYSKAVSQFEFSRQKNWGRYYGVPDDGKFLDYCELLWKLKDRQDFWPSIPQTRFTHGPLQLDYLIRFETLQQDWTNLIKEYQISGLPEQLTHENKGREVNWRDHFCDKSKEIIDEVFDLDFRLLKYQKTI